MQSNSLIVVTHDETLRSKFDYSYRTAPERTLSEIHADLQQVLEAPLMLQSENVQRIFNDLAFLFCDGLYKMLETEHNFQLINFYLEELKWLHYRNNDNYLLALVNYNLAILHNHRVAPKTKAGFHLVVDSIFAFQKCFDREENDKVNQWAESTVMLAEHYLREDFGNHHVSFVLILEIFRVDAALLSESFSVQANQVHHKCLLKGIHNRSFFDAMIFLAGKHQVSGSIAESIMYYLQALEFAGKIEGLNSPLCRALIHNLNQLERYGDVYVRYVNDNLFVSKEEEKEYGVWIEKFVEYYREANFYEGAFHLLKKSFSFRSYISLNPLLHFRYLYDLSFYASQSAQHCSALLGYMEALEVYQLNELYREVTLKELYLIYESIAAILIDQLRYVTSAEYYLMKGLEVKRQVPDISPQEIAISYSDLALYFIEIEKIDEAEKYYSYYIEEVKKFNSANDEINIPLSQTVGGIIAFRKGNHEKAIKCFNATIEVFEQHKIDDPKEFAQIYLFLGLVYEAKMNFIEACGFYYKAKVAYEQRHLNNYRLFEQINFRLGIIYVNIASSSSDHLFKQGIGLLRASAHRDSEMIHEIFSIGSEDHRYRMLMYMYEKIYALMATFVKFEVTDIDSKIILYNYVLRRKAINLKIDRLQRLKFEGLDPHSEIGTAEQRIAETQDELTMAIIHGHSPSFIEALHAKLTEAAVWKDFYILRDRRILSPEVILSTLRAEDYSSVVLGLGDDTVLVEFVKYKPFSYYDVRATQKEQQRYLAFIIKPVLRDIEMIEIGDCRDIDMLIKEYKNFILQTPTRSPTSSQSATGHQLRKKIFDSWISSAEDCKKIIICPDGELSLLPFEILPLESGKFVVDEFSISYVGTGRDCANFNDSTQEETYPPVIIGNPSYSIEYSEDLIEDGPIFRSLPATELEAKTVGALLGVEPLLGLNASKKNVLRIRSPKVLHMATHEFNLLGVKNATTNGPSFSPLFLTGLCLSGINDFSVSGTKSKEHDNGFLSAVNILQLDLRHTELVVLSACETGNGAHAEGEGVMGLRRAFAIAGAASQVVSLWKVPDKPTALFMTEFYQHLVSGESNVEALRSARRILKEKYSSPFYWGAFVCFGKPLRLVKA